MPRPKRPLPPHWKELMDRAGLASIRALAARAGINHQAANDLIYGSAKHTQDRTIASVAGALGVPMADVYWLAGQPNPAASEYTPPAEANRLSTRQRAAVDEVIRLLADPAAGADVDWAPDNVRTLRRDVHPERDGLDVAAHAGHGLSEGQQMWEVGEESQDSDDGPET